MDAAPWLFRGGNASHPARSPTQMKLRALAWAVVVLVPLSCFFGISLALDRMQTLHESVRGELDELLLADAQALAAKQGIRWDEERELADVAALAAYNGIPVGLGWQFRLWENGSKLYAWGQIVRDGSVRALFKPTRQQAAQAMRTLRRAYQWFLLAHSKEVKESLKKRGLKLQTSPQRVLDDPAIRRQFVRFIVEDVWRARSGRKKQNAFILGAWEKWDTERGKP